MVNSNSNVVVVNFNTQKNIPCIKQFVSKYTDFAFKTRYGWFVDFTGVDFEKDFGMLIDFGCCIDFPDFLKQGFLQFILDLRDHNDKGGLLCLNKVIF